MPWLSVAALCAVLAGAVVEIRGVTERPTRLSEVCGARQGKSAAAQLASGTVGKRASVPRGSAACLALLEAGPRSAALQNAPAPGTQAPIPITALTVPADQLPAGCRLRPVDPNATGAARFAMGRVRYTNPWTATPPEPVASVRHMVEGQDYVSATHNGFTGPALHARLEVGVAEAYGARYIAADGSEIDVWAVRYTDPKLAAPALLMRLDGTQARRFVIGAIAALVWRSGNDWRTATASGEACAEAVRSYLVVATSHSGGTRAERPWGTRKTRAQARD